MKNVLIVLCFFISVNTTKEANTNLVSICKYNESKIRIDYLDSTHSITNVKTKTKGDTLFLDIYVAFNKPQKYYYFSIDSEIKFIKIGNKNFDFSFMEKCAN